MLQGETLKHYLCPFGSGGCGQGFVGQAGVTVERRRDGAADARWAAHTPKIIVINTSAASLLGSGMDAICGYLRTDGPLLICVRDKIALPSNCTARCALP
jgi:hypothetical protein